jgi:hypothetical protein
MYATHNASIKQALGYLGSVLMSWANNHNQTLARVIRSKAASVVDSAILKGFDPPSILHARGSIALDMKDDALAIRYFTAALRRAEEMELMAGDAPIQDTISVPHTLNQLGNAYMATDQLSEAVGKLSTPSKFV